MNKILSRDNMNNILSRDKMNKNNKYLKILI